MVLRLGQAAVGVPRTRPAAHRSRETTDLTGDRMAWSASRPDAPRRDGGGNGFQGPQGAESPITTAEDRSRVLIITHPHRPGPTPRHRTALARRPSRPGPTRPATRRAPARRPSTDRPHPISCQRLTAHPEEGRDAAPSCHARALTFAAAVMAVTAASNVSTSPDTGRSRPLATGSMLPPRDSHQNAAAPVTPAAPVASSDGAERAEVVRLVNAVHETPGCPALTPHTALDAAAGTTALTWTAPANSPTTDPEGSRRCSVVRTWAPPGAGWGEHRLAAQYAEAPGRPQCVAQRLPAFQPDVAAWCAQVRCVIARHRSSPRRRGRHASAEEGPRE